MSITIKQIPFNFSGFRQRQTIVMAQSTNILQDGFRFKVVITGAGRTLYSGYVPPNPANTLVFDLFPVISNLGQQRKATVTTSIHRSFAASGGAIGFNERYPTNPDPALCDTLADEPIGIQIDEAWLVGGILTDNPDIHSGYSTDLILFNRTAQVDDGYRKNPDSVYAMNSGRAFLTNRVPSTHKWDYAETEGQFSAERIYIPTFSNDFGILSIPYVSQANKTARDLPSYTATKARITLVPATGSSTSVIESITSLQDGVVHLPLYPGNVEISTLASLAAIKPSINANWKCYTVSLLRTDNTPASAVYVIYNAERYYENDCRYNRVRLGWVNSQGGYDYFNFIKKSEQSIEVETKEYQTALGNYGSASGTAGGETPFSFVQEDRGLTNSAPLVKQYLNVDSDWLSRGEFLLLKWLIASRDVHWIDTSGNHMPMIVTDRSYLVRDERNGKKYNVSLRLQMAHNLNG
jgi:hypothetical protein